METICDRCGNYEVSRVKITLSNGKQFKIKEEKCGKLEITTNDSIIVFLRYVNQVEIDSSEIVEMG